MSPCKKLRNRINKPGVLTVPGIYDGISLRLAEHVGFDAAFLSGAGLSMARFGRPDFGFTGLDELVGAVAAMTETVSIPLIVDIDTGFGNALNVTRTVRRLEQAGAAALQMEDQTSPKRCGHIAGKKVIDAAEMGSKIQAACDARNDSDTLIIARTDALAVTGFDDAMYRAQMYLEAGADALFIEAPKNITEMKQISMQFGNRITLIHNFVEGGNSPISNMHELEDIGYKVGLFPLAFMHAAIPAGRAMLNHLKQTGQTKYYKGNSDDLTALNAAVGLQEWLAKAKEYS